MSTPVAATVAGRVVTVAEVDERETELRATVLASALPRPDTSEGRQLRRWLTQLIVAERVVEAEPVDVFSADVPAEHDLLPDTAARLEIGSIAASVLRAERARAVFVRVTADVRVDDAEVAEYHARNPSRFSTPVVVDGWWHHPPVPQTLDEARPAVAAHLLASARRRRFRLWLDARRAELVALAPGYEHPGDPRQPDNTHKH
jgi:[acyl-carrier-protein] S-malonyltransferase